MLVYLDTCCYNRPYDDQSQNRVALETRAIMLIQNKIINGEVGLVSSYVLYLENHDNKDTFKRYAVKNFMDKYSSVYISSKHMTSIIEQAKQFMNYRLHDYDAYHVACAIHAKSDYFLTTDDRLIKALSFRVSNIAIMNPVIFIKVMEGKL